MLHRWNDDRDILRNDTFSLQKLQQTEFTHNARKEATD
jgi:hypothetical protein